MAFIRQYFCIRNIWGLASALNYINIFQLVYFNVFFHGNLLQCTNVASYSLILELIKILMISPNIFLSDVLQI